MVKDSMDKTEQRILLVMTFKIIETDSIYVFLLLDLAASSLPDVISRIYWINNTMQHRKCLGENAFVINHCIDPGRPY